MPEAQEVYFSENQRILLTDKMMYITWRDIGVLLVGVLLCIILYVKWVYKYWERRKVPYLEPILPMGNFEAPWNIQKSIHFTVADFYRKFKAKGHKYGGIFSSLRPVFVPVDLDILKHIMIKDFQYFASRGVYYNEKADPLSATMFTIEGDKWRSLRTRLSPTFTTGKMKYMFQMVMDCAKGLENEISKLCANNQEVNIKEMGALFTADVINSCAFGLDCNSFENPNNDFRRHTRNFFQGGLGRVLHGYITRSFPDLCTKLGVTAFPTEMTDFYIEVMRNIVNYRESNDIKRSDFVQLLLNIKNGKDANGDTFTFNDIAAQAVVFFLAGFENASSIMTFAFYEMAKNQDIQDKVREEIRRVTEKYNGEITYESIMEMNYISQVFDETLRKYPIVATLERVATSDYKVPGENLVLKQGTKVVISLQGIHHDPEYYPDPERFDPERFSQENKESRHPCAYMPFGRGPRICIGFRFGIMETKIAMAIMLKDYKYTLNPKASELKFSNKAILLAPMGDVLLNVEKVN